MRDYGVVRVRFWEWAKRRLLGPDERELALYLLTSPHGNSLGCFRLPLAYLCDDLERDGDTVARALARPSGIGFLERDEATGWTWIKSYLEHNPIPNRNVGKAVEKQLDAVPACVTFPPRLIEALRATARADNKGLSLAVLDRMAERSRNGSATISRESKTQTQTHTHTHDPTHEPIREHDHDHDGHSDADASGATAPTQTGNLRRETFQAGIEILMAAGRTEQAARHIIGKWRKDHDDEAVLDAIEAARAEDVIEPVSYITRCLQGPRTKPQPRSVETVEEIIARLEAKGCWDGILL